MISNFKIHVLQNYKPIDNLIRKNDEFCETILYIDFLFSRAVG